MRLRLAVVVPALVTRVLVMVPALVTRVQGNARLRVLVMVSAARPAGRRRRSLSSQLRLLLQLLLRRPALTMRARRRACVQLRVWLPLWLVKHTTHAPTTAVSATPRVPMAARPISVTVLGVTEAAAQAATCLLAAAIHLGLVCVVSHAPTGSLRACKCVHKATPASAAVHRRQAATAVRLQARHHRCPPPAAGVGGDGVRDSGMRRPPQLPHLAGLGAPRNDMTQASTKCRQQVARELKLR